MTSHIRSAITLICAVGCTATAGGAGAGRITLNDTGMTQCIDHQGNWSLECEKSHQDAAYGRDVSDADPEDGVAGFSFRKVCRSGESAGEGSCPVDPPLGSGPNDWGCIYDNISQLVWEAKTDDGGIHDYMRRFTNKGRKSADDSSDAAWLVAATNTEALCGAANWRLPDAHELQSIVNFGRGTPDVPNGPFVDPNFFPYTYPFENWTRTEVADDSKQTWYVNFVGGRISAKHRWDSFASARLVHRPVRPLSGVKPNAVAKERFIPSQDGTEVTDTMTGLVWRRCSEGTVWNGATQTCDGTATRFQWKEALQYARDNREGGWRIPNIKELFSIVDHTRVFPSIDPIAFPSVPRVESFLSATPINQGGDVNAKYVYFDRGVVEDADTFRGNNWALRLVRRGRE